MKHIVLLTDGESNDRGYEELIARMQAAQITLSTLAIGLACGVGLYVFAIFAAVFVLGVLLVIESIDPLKPAVMKATDSPDFLYLLMPVRIS